MGYSVSSAAMYPAIRYTGRLQSDPLGTMQAETSIIEGTGAQVGSNRWGDYSAMAIDPVDDCTFWYTNEYIPANGDYNWHTRIASFKSSAGTELTGAPPAREPEPDRAFSDTVRMGGNETAKVTHRLPPI